MNERGLRKRVTDRALSALNEDQRRAVHRPAPAGDREMPGATSEHTAKNAGTSGRSAGALNGGGPHRDDASPHGYPVPVRSRVPVLDEHRSTEGKRYFPDFYLPDQPETWGKEHSPAGSHGGVWLKHFANGELPERWEGDDAESTTEYRRTRAWKETLHRKRRHGGIPITHPPCPQVLPQPRRGSPSVEPGRSASTGELREENMLPVRYPSRDEARRYRHELRHSVEALRERSRPDADALAWPAGLDRGILLGLPLRDGTHR